MWKNYLKIAFRTLQRRKGYALLNLAGLTLGMACCLLIFQYVAFEYSFDRFHENASTLYRVTQTSVRGGDEPATESMSGSALGPALAQELPEVVRFTRLHPDYTNPIVSTPSQPDEAFEEEHVYYADPAFLEMFSFPLVAGDPARALAEPGTVLLSETAARRYFGAEDPIGQVLDVTGWISGRFRVNGVFRDVPAASHLRFDLLFPMEDLLQRSGYSDPITGWRWYNFNTYVQLRDDADVAAAEQKLTAVLMRHRGEDLRQSNTTVQMDLQPLRDIHLNDDISAPRVVMGSYRTVYFFTLIGLVTLLIAVINYVNLATARALDRAREVGVRKVVGAQRGQLTGQFLFEAALTNLVALGLALLLAALLQPVVSTLAGMSLLGLLWMNPWFWAALAIMLSVGTLITGLYPAFVLSSFAPMAVLKGERTTSGDHRLWLRQGLVILQFTASIVLLVGTVVVHAQLSHMRTMDLGIDLEQILAVPGPRILGDATGEAEATRTFAQELRAIPAVRQVATSSTLPGQGFDWYTSEVRRLTADPSTGVNGVLTRIDTAFAHLYGLELIAGTGFEGLMSPPPEGEPIPIIATETSIRALGFDSPAEALDEGVYLGGAEGRIVGVFEDFSWSSAHIARENAFFAFSPGNQFSIKVGTEQLPQTLAAIERTYTTLFPGNPFRYTFLDEAFDRQYQSDQRFATLFSLFTGVAILIACLGLIGLASFSAQKRTKEIGVRKVLGASAPSLVAMLSKDFLKPVGIALLLALPVAHYAMSQWLENFAYRVELSPWMFGAAGAAALLTALTAVSYQSARAALSDPVKSLRYE